MKGGLRLETLAELFALAPAALVCADRAGRITVVNRAASRLLGRRPDELVGRSVGELVGESTRAAWLELVLREVRDGRRYEGEALLEGPQGSRIPVVTAAEQDAAGAHLILSFRDVSGQKRLQQQFFESRKLASLGKVVEGVAHEVRNPLISIGGFARKLQRLTGPEGGQYLEVILAEVRRLEQMVADIEAYVEFTKHHRPCFRSLALSALLSDTLAEAGARLEAADIRTDFSPSADLPQIYGDPELLRALFSGLLENACDAMPQGGTLSLSVGTDGRWAVVGIRDTGVGIPEEDLGDIFDPFVTSKTTGAGLGLAKAYIIVEEHSGRIEFESQVGKGTICTVSLPIERRRVARTSGCPVERSSS